MTEEHGRDELTADTALESPADDKLGYADFSTQLAQAITSRIPSDGFTIGIYGPWGAGKSTILNFVEDNLNRIDDSPVVVRFNPWWFSGRADLIEKFFSQLGASLESEDGFSNIRTRLATLSSTLSAVPFSAFTGVPAEYAFPAVANMLQPEDESIEELKDQIAEDLEQADRDVIVIVDDIDRLTAGEIRQIFQLIKSVADFPNVAYVLAFDQDVVIDALEDEQGVRDGEQYLRKIVQLPLRIPSHEQGTLESLFIERLAGISDDEIDVDQERWTRLLRDGIMPILSTPRDAIRLVNTIDIAYATMGEEVNFTDLVGLELLRVFYRDIYETIRHSPGRFVGRNRRHPRSGDETDDYADLFKEIDDSERAAVETILKLLFPRIKDSLTDVYTFHENWDDFRAEKRICHSDRFMVYFRLTIPEGEISEVKMNELMSMTSDSDQFAEKLTEMLQAPGREGKSKANTFLSRFTNRLSEVDADDAGSVVRALLAIGDEVIAHDRPQQSLRGSDKVVMDRTIRSLLEKQDENSRIRTLETAIADGSSPYFSLYLVEGMLRDHGEYDAEPAAEDQRLLELEKTEGLKPFVVESVKEAADEGTLIEVPQLRHILKRWGEWSDSVEPEQWVKDLTNTSEGLLLLLEQFRKPITSSKLNTYGTDVHYYIDPRWVGKYLDLSEVESRLQSIDETDIDDADQDVVETFERGLEKLDNGEDPGSPEAWIFDR